MTRAQFFDYWIIGCWVLLFAYISLVPFYYLQPVQLSLHHSAFTLLKYLPICFVGVLCFNTLILKRARFFRTPLDIWMGLYFIFCALSLVGAQYGVVGGLKLGYYAITGLLLPGLMVAQIQNERDLTCLLKGLVLISGLVAFYGLTVYISGQDYLWGWAHDTHNPYFGDISRLSSSLGNAVFAGSYFVLCLPLTLWLVISKAPRQWIWKLCFVLTVSALFLTFSRSAWISGCIACCICLRYLLGSLYHTFSKKFKHINIIGFLLLFLLMLPVLESLGFREPMARFGSMWQERMVQVLDDTGGESFRIAQYGTALRVLRDHPVLGVGFGNFTRLFDYYKHPSTPINSSSRTTENMYLMVVCETGLLGLIAFGILLAQLIVCIYRGVLKRVTSNSQFLLACLGALVGLLVNMFTWDAFNQPTIRMAFWMVAGIALVQLRLLSHSSEGGQ